MVKITLSESGSYYNGRIAKDGDICEIIGAGTMGKIRDKDGLNLPISVK